MLCDHIPTCEAQAAIYGATYFTCTRYLNNIGVNGKTVNMALMFERKLNKHFRMPCPRGPIELGNLGRAKNEKYNGGCPADVLISPELFPSGCCVQPWQNRSI